MAALSTLIDRCQTIKVSDLTVCKYVYNHVTQSSYLQQTNSYQFSQDIEHYKASKSTGVTFVS